VLPNPSREEVRIALAVPTAGRATIECLDVQGRRVARLDASVDSGASVVSWDGRDDAGLRVAPGVYFVRVTVDGRTTTARLVRRP
jgi:flagellar hook assembly protein FlgD